MNKIEYTMNSKGGIFLNFKDYQFSKDRTLPCKIYWACTQRRSLG